MSEVFSNYFNYFTEIEEHFQKARGTGLFLLSPLDWALIESWKNADIPLEAVLRGIDASFEKWRARRSRTQLVNSLAFCAQAVLTEAQRNADNSPQRPAENPAPFPANDVREYLKNNARQLRLTGAETFGEIAAALDQLAADVGESVPDLEKLEQRLAMLEQRVIAVAIARQTEGDALAARQQLEAYLRPYRSRMSAPQLAMLEKQFLERNALESVKAPRLSLFYLH